MRVSVLSLATRHCEGGARSNLDGGGLHAGLLRSAMCRPLAMTGGLNPCRHVWRNLRAKCLRC
ncbi:MAG: hypothetical protein LBT00_12095 [Spirochaetaceae bacterium]|nr:hypothetical protein [Spirochaetaceae bacterium]